MDSYGQMFHVHMYHQSGRLYMDCMFEKVYTNNKSQIIFQPCEFWMSK